MAIFFLGMMLPTSVSLNLGGLRLSVYRVVLIVMFVPMVLSLMSGKRGKPNVFDYLVIGHSGWALIALIKWGGIAQGIESGGIYIVEYAGAYFLGRLYIRSCDDFNAFAKAYVGVVVWLLIFTIPEALTEIHILHDFFASGMGAPKAPYIDKRMGLERTFGPFDHPILYGVFSASAFSMSYFVVAERKLMNFRGMGKVFGVTLATFMSASGGPYVVLLIQGFVGGWERVLFDVRGRWRALFGMFLAVYLWIDLMSTRTPFHVFVTYFTFSTESAYNRINIWNYGTAEVARYPIFGIGLGDWTRPVWMSDSMDNFWLLIAVRYGLPGWAMLVALMLGLVIATSRKREVPEDWLNARHAWAFTLFGISVAAATVHLWNALFVLFLFLIGSGVWMYDTNPPRAGEDPAQPRNKPARRRQRETFF
ncbi:MAG: O-antigen ligase family protein [Pikeienuella sp.]